MKEWIDIINEKDEVIEKATREECHRKRLRHRAVRIFILNTKGELFIQKRSAKKDVYPGYYEGSLSGHVLSGESYEEAAVRELREELNIKSKPRELFKYEVSSKEENAIFNLFVLEGYDKKIILDKKEVASGRFESLETIKKDIAEKKRKFTPGFVKAVEIYLQSV